MATSASEGELREILGDLVLWGVEPFWVKEVGARLMKLACVLAQLSEVAEPTEDQLVEAVVATLREAVASLGSRQYRTLLMIVLALDKQYIGKTLRQRRIEAGKRFRDGSHEVSWMTIRSHHERKALDLLAAVLDRMEQQATGTARLF